MKIDIIIATKNRDFLLKQTLQSFQRLNIENLIWKIIIVDNGSNDSTPQIIKEFIKLLPITSLIEEQAGKNRCLNRALQLTDSELIVFTDDDVISDNMWLQELVAAAKRWPQDGVFGGRVIPLMPTSTPNWIDKIDKNFTKMAFGCYNYDIPESVFDKAPLGANFAIRSSIIKNFRFNEKIGPRNQKYAIGGETELLHRIRKQNLRYIYVPSAKVEHVIQKHQVTFKWLCHRSWLAGRGWARMNPNVECPYLFGAPRYMWRELLELSLRYLLTIHKSKSTRFEIAKKLYTIRGAIKEYQLMINESK